MRGKIAQMCNEQYGLSYTEADITDCEGCRSSSGRLFAGCTNCEVRKCAEKKKYNTCAECENYICPELQKMYIKDSTGKMWLDIVRAIF